MLQQSTIILARDEGRRVIILSQCDQTSINSSTSRHCAHFRKKTMWFLIRSSRKRHASQQNQLHQAAEIQNYHKSVSGLLPEYHSDWGIGNHCRQHRVLSCERCDLQAVKRCSAVAGWKHVQKIRGLGIPLSPSCVSNNGKSSE